MDTCDLDSYYPGYDDYCDDLDEQAKVPYIDYERLENKVDKYDNMIEEVESALEEDASTKERIKMIKSIIEDFRSEIND